MKKIIIAGLLLAPVFTTAQEVRNLDSIVIVATQAAKDAPVAHSRVTRETLSRTAPTQNLPYALALTPGAVVVGENGQAPAMPICEFGVRRIAHTGEFERDHPERCRVAGNILVNLPALSGFLENVQVQRGVGTSVNGSGAFGATVNMRTLFNRPDPYAGAEWPSARSIPGMLPPGPVPVPAREQLPSTGHGRGHTLCSSRTNGTSATDRETCTPLCPPFLDTAGSFTKTILHLRGPAYRDYLGRDIP